MSLSVCQKNCPQILFQNNDLDLQIKGITSLVTIATTFNEIIGFNNCIEHVYDKWKQYFVLHGSVNTLDLFSFVCG